jgi:hypothetical protein
VVVDARILVASPAAGVLRLEVASLWTAPGRGLRVVAATPSDEPSARRLAELSEAAATAPWPAAATAPWPAATADGATAGDEATAGDQVTAEDEVSEAVAEATGEAVAGGVATTGTA